MEIDLFVIGAASLDTLHLANGQTVHTIGGAGLYTALAAQRSGLRTGLFAPRPEPAPERLRSVQARLAWLGPVIAPADLPRLEIEHHGQGRATLRDASWGAETRLRPEAMPAQIGAAAAVHIAALSSAERQLAFLEALQTYPRRPRLSVGTYARLVYHSPAAVRRLFEQADLFFMNENEAKGLFGSVAQAHTRPEAVLFVTLDAAGALVIEGSRATPVPGRPVAELDPTGAGDTFCGAALAGLLQGLTPVAAAQQAVELAAQTVSAIGPAALLSNVSFL